MPTGYTAKLCDKEVPFKEFALTCARNFGALVEMREDGLEVPIPEQFEVSHYHEEAMRKALLQLAALSKMSLAEAELKAEEEYQEAKARWEKSNKAQIATRDRLLSMRAQVTNWQPPSPDHEGLKSFMIEQLDSTLRYDGTIHPFSIKKQSGLEWIRHQEESARRDIEYHKSEQKKEEKRTQERNLWLAQLRASLPAK